MSYKRPHFVREESWRLKRVRESWRSPRGKTSRVRRSKDGWPPVVKIGYAHPKATRGGHPSGLKEIMVFKLRDLEGIDPKTQAVRIAHTVGERKRVEILDQAKKANIRVLNPGPKKEAEVTPEVTAEATTPTESTAESDMETLTKETEPKEETTKTETTEAPAKERKTSKKTKKRSKE